MNSISNAGYHLPPPPSPPQHSNIHIRPPLLRRTTLRTIPTHLINILHAPTPRLIMRHASRTRSMFLRILIINKQLTILAIPSRLVPCNSHDVEPAGQSAFGLAEDVVDFLEGAVGGFRVEEVDDGENESVYYGEDYVGFVADGAECDGGDHDNHEVESPGS